MTDLKTAFDAKNAAARAVSDARAAFVAAADHPQARDDAYDVEMFAELFVASVRTKRDFLAHLQPDFILGGGRKLTTADTFDWAERMAEIAAEPMKAEAKALFLAAVKLESLK